MVTFIARVRIVPGREEAALARAGDMVKAVKELEPGALVYMAHRSHNDLGVMVFFEVYKDKKAREAHDQTPHFAELVKDFGEVFDIDYGVQVEMLSHVAGFTRYEGD
ncbi:MAG: Antibiotic biosynthesis monooxygenase [Candidatus Hydrogenedentes bacterium]|nr:Antibiotic biosynthesis monooxygenase [Candidatus Hydrogenedentota bacterium]